MTNVTKWDRNDTINQIRAVEIAGLFHDIGKFEQHTMETMRIKHSKLSTNLIEKINLPKNIDNQTVKKLVEDHHEKEIDLLNLFDLKRADNTASTSDREESEEDSIPNQQIESIFSNIYLENYPKYFSQMRKFVKKTYYNPTKIQLPINLKEVFPTKNKLRAKSLTSLNEKLWNEFTETLQRLPKDMEYIPWIITVEAILRKYCYNILSSGYKTNPNIGLYHHLTTVAAISRCSFHYNILNTVNGQSIKANNLKKENRYLYIKGDLSGIQKFIFKMTIPQLAHKGTSKRLRGRSFLIQLIADSAIHTVLNKLGLSVNNIITSAGGNFTILAPNSQEIKEELVQLRKDINSELFTRFKMDLLFNLAWVEASNDDLENYRLLGKKIANAINLEKLRPLHYLLGDSDTKISLNSKFSKSIFSPSTNPSPDSKKCAVCDLIYQKKKNVEICNECELQEDLGKLLTKTKYILREYTPVAGNQFSDHFSFQFFSNTYYFMDSLEKIKRLNRGCIISLESSIIIDPELLSKGFSFTFQFLGISIPKSIAANPLSFDELAKASIGMDKFAIVKADVDNLGNLIINGIGTKEGSKTSLSKLKDLSTRIDLFFSGIVPKIASSINFCLFFKPCESHLKFFKKIDISEDIVERDEQIELFRHLKYQDYNEEALKCKKCLDGKYTTAIYSVFSGGDDLAYVGPWDLIIDFSMEINQEFEKYVSSNPWLTLSAGIGLFSTNNPISDALIASEYYLEQSKTRFEVIQNGEIINPKNAITLFGETISWSKNHDRFPFMKDFQNIGNFKELSDFKNYLMNLMKEDKQNFSRSFVMKLIELWNNAFYNKTFKEIHDSRLTQIEYSPLLAYQIARRTSKNRDLKSEVFNRTRKVMPWVVLPATWIYYLSKQKLGENNV